MKPLLFTDPCDLETPEQTKVFGGKGANLRRMVQDLQLPVPPGFTYGTNVCAAFLGADLDDNVLILDQCIADAKVAMQALEQELGRTFGESLYATGAPLLVSVRSGAPISMPGMMDTILNLGLNDNTVESLAAATNEDFAYDAYRRFCQMYLTIVEGVPAEPINALVDAAKRFMGDDLLPAAVSKLLIQKFKTMGDVPHDVWDQLHGAIYAVFMSWESDRAIAYRKIEGIPDNLFTACTVQAMVFGNLNDKSGTGVVFTRNPTTGEAVPYGDFLVQAQGEDVVNGSRVTLPFAQMSELFPEQTAELNKYMVTLDNYFEDMCDIEFTIEDEKLWILQVRKGKRTPKAAIKILLDTASGAPIPDWDGLFNEIIRITGLETKIVTNDGYSTKLGHGLAACDGEAIGRIAFTAERAIQMAKDGPVILVREETDPNDVEGMTAAEGILTMKGGLVSHAAVCARMWNKPCIVSAVIGGFWIDHDSEEPALWSNTARFTEGEWIKLAIANGEGNIYKKDN